MPLAICCISTCQNESAPNTSSKVDRDGGISSGEAESIVLGSEPEPAKGKTTTETRRSTSCNRSSQESATHQSTIGSEPVGQRDEMDLLSNNHGGPGPREKKSSRNGRGDVDIEDFDSCSVGHSPQIGVDWLESLVLVIPTHACATSALPTHQTCMGPFHLDQCPRRLVQSICGINLCRIFTTTCGSAS